MRRKSRLTRQREASVAFRFDGGARRIAEKISRRSSGGMEGEREGWGRRRLRVEEARAISPLAAAFVEQNLYVQSSQPLYLRYGRYSERRRTSQRVDAGERLMRISFEVTQA